MRIVLQRVLRASVRIEGRIHSTIDRGLLLLLAIHSSDSPAQAKLLAEKTAQLRIFPDDAGKMNRSAQEAGLAALVVSQFTLYGDCRKGRRPNFMAAARPEIAIPLYELFCTELATHLSRVERGIFGAEMQIELINDGPVTLILESDSGNPGRHQLQLHGSP